jgi:hypothetical protein
MEKINASMVIYNTDRNVVENAVRSFRGSAFAGTLYIIDNAVTDIASSWFEAPGIVYYHSPKNLGYGRAHNIALRQSMGTAKYHLVLNPDVYFEAAVLEQLYYFMEEHPAAGLVMPRVLYPDGSLQRLCKLLPSPLNLAARRFLPFSDLLFRQLNERYEMRFSNYNRVMNVPFLSGCFMFLRTDALRTTGVFDERFFMYAEDADLSRRIHRQFKTLFYPYAEIYHIHARGSYKNTRHTFYNLRSAFQYFMKWGWYDPERRSVNKSAIQQFSLSEPVHSIRFADVSADTSTGK